MTLQVISGNPKLIIQVMIIITVGIIRKPQVLIINHNRHNFITKIRNLSVNKYINSYNINMKYTHAHAQTHTFIVLIILLIRLSDTISTIQ